LGKLVLIMEVEGTDAEEGIVAAVVDTEEGAEEEDIMVAEEVVARAKVLGEVAREPMVRILLRLRRHRHEDLVLLNIVSLYVNILLGILRQAEFKYWYEMDEVGSYEDAFSNLDVLVIGR